MKKDGCPTGNFPTAEKLAFDKVSSFINTLDFDKAKDIIDSPGPVSKYGLDKPKMEVVFKQGANEALRLSFGGDSKTPEGIFVKAANPSVKVVGKDVYDRFNVKADGRNETDRRLRGSLRMIPLKVPDWTWGICYTHL